MSFVLIVLGILIVGGAAALVVVGLRQAGDVDPLEERLAEFADMGEAASLEDIELSQPFRDRILIPLSKKLGEIALRFTPQNAIQEATVKMERAGNPRGLDPTVFFSLRLGVGIFLGVAMFIVLNVLAGDNVKVLYRIGGPFLFAALGFYLPDLWLTSKITRRQDAVRKAMPDALDLLTICVEAGLGFDAAMKKVNEKWDNELALSFGRALQEMQLGKLRREALRDMADRLGVSEMDSFIAAVIQSEQLGVSMAKVLRIQSDDMRVKRRQKAEEEAQKAPVKMLFPMAFLIFPTIMLILLGPAGLQLTQSALGDIFF
ncbi:MAG: type II secretion system F family protein [Anaerolineales bacterium]|nr:type II secretion system F family protein [Anaerolineales bacterium]